MDIDIVDLSEKLSPLGFKFAFKDDLPTDEKVKAIAKALEEADEEEDLDEGDAKNLSTEATPKKVGKRFDF